MPYIIFMPRDVRGSKQEIEMSTDHTSQFTPAQIDRINTMLDNDDLLNSANADLIDVCAAVWDCPRYVALAWLATMPAA